MEKDFSLAAFVRNVQEMGSETEEYIERTERTLHVMNILFNHSYITDEILETVTTEDLEWLFDTIYYWPAEEGDLRIEDTEHIGYQKIAIDNLIKTMSTMRSDKRKVKYI